MAAILPFLPAIAGAATSFLGGTFGRKEKQETPIQKQQRQLVDQLLGSLRGEGPYADLFAANEADFERGFADPARARFRNVTAPQIQQAYISQGQQRSTGLEDTLTRAGVDMDALINENYLNYLQSAQNRKANTIGQILGQGPGAPRQQSWQNAAGQGLSGYLSGEGFGKDFENLLSSFRNKGSSPQDMNALTDTYRPPSKGFEQENQYYNPYTGVMG